MNDDTPDPSPVALVRRWGPLATLPVLLFFGIWMGLQVHFLRADTTALRDEVAALHTQVVELKRTHHTAGLRNTPSRPSGAALPATPKAKKATKSKAKSKSKAKGAKADAPPVDADGDGQPDAPRAKAKGKAKAPTPGAAEGEGRDAKAQPRKAKGKKKRKKRKPAAR